MVLEHGGYKPTPLYSDGPVVKLKFAFFPHWCAMTRKRIWLEKAYRSVEQYHVRPGAIGRGVTYTHWFDKNEYIKWKLMQ